MYSVTASVNRAACSSGAGDGHLRRQRPVALLFEREEGVRAPQFALHEHDLVLPGVRHQVDVLQVPVVVLDAHSRRSGLRGRLRVEPGGERVGRLFRLLDVRLQARPLAEPRRQLFEVCGSAP